MGAMNVFSSSSVSQLRRKVERYIIKAIQEGVRNSTFSWKVSKLEVDVQGTWIMELTPERMPDARDFFFFFLFLDVRDRERRLCV
jgi:hypothetical protein